MNKIDEFLLNYKAKKTKACYKTYLKKYFNIIGTNPDTYFDEDRDYEKDVKRYWQELNKSPPKTIYTAMTTIRVFLSENDIELPTKFWRNIRNRTQGTRAVTEENIPSNENLKKILSHADVKARALFLTLSSSGMRIGEATKIKIKDIHYDYKPTKINIRAEFTKSGNRRICFISNEATEAIEAWLKHREAYLVTACSRSKGVEQYHNRKERKSSDDDRLFPFSPGTASGIWNTLLKNAEFGEIDERTKIHKMHLHTLRKFFRTRLSLKVPLDVVEALMGHEGYLTEAYRRYSEAQLGELYLQGEHTLNVFESSVEEERIKKLETQLEETRQELEQVREASMDINKILADPKLAKAFALKMLPIFEELKENK